MKDEEQYEILWQEFCAERRRNEDLEQENARLASKLAGQAAYIETLRARVTELKSARSATLRYAADELDTVADALGEPAVCECRKCARRRSGDV